MPRQKPRHLPTAEANFERCIDTSELTKLPADAFNARLAQANLIKKKQILMLNC